MKAKIVEHTKAIEAKLNVQVSGSDVAEIVTGTKNRNANGFSNPPVRYNKTANWMMS